MNLIFTCGGTAGHINPAIAIAKMMQERHPDARILFIGATGHMEEKLVPAAGTVETTMQRYLATSALRMASCRPPRLSA